MNDEIEKEGIRRAIDRFQKEHPCHLPFDVTRFNHNTDFGVIQRAIDMVAKKCQEDADIHIICEMAKLYLEGVRPIVERPHGEWIFKNDNPLIKMGYWECSKCKKGRLLVEENFCPNCGSDNRKKEDKPHGS